MNNKQTKNKTSKVKNPVKIIKKSDKELSAEYLQGWQRALADYENLKKETDVKSKIWIEMGIMRVIDNLIPVYSNFKSAVDHIPNDQKDLPWVQGVIYIKKNFEDIFNELGLKVIKTVGEQFDEKLHHAISEEESNEDSPPGTILKEVSVGFVKEDKVIIPAKVVVKK